MKWVKDQPGWNKHQQNEVTYPDHPDLEQALCNFREQRVWYEQQQKFRTKGVDTAPITDAWNTFLRLKKKYGLF